MPEFTDAEKAITAISLSVVAKEVAKEQRFWAGVAARNDANGWAEGAANARRFADEARGQLKAARSALKKLGG